MTKKVIWAVLTVTPDKNEVSIYASYALANEAARKELDEGWRMQEAISDEDPGPMPDDWSHAFDAMQENGMGETYVDVTHYTIETDELENA